MKYAKVNSDTINILKQICGEKFVFTDEENRRKYAKDQTEDLHFMPEVVVKPETPQQVSAILNLANTFNIPVTPRGAGTGLSGGALPVLGGILLSMEKFNRILEIDERNLQATVEPGVITQVFQEEVIKKGLYYPPDPASRGSCFIGGNLAENSGGPKAVKYGVTKDYVLNLEVVLPTGEIVWTGANVLKNATGYNLTQLMIGSEGTLGVITKAVFRLIPYPAQTLLMLVPFYRAEQACEAVSAIFRAGITPSVLEFMEKEAIDFGIKYINGISLSINPTVEAHLLIEVDGNNADALLLECEKIYEVLSSFECDEILLADDNAKKENLWRMRRGLGEAVKAHSIYKEEDTVVPRAELPVLLKGVKEIGKKYGFSSVCYGHAGDGNLHVNILKGSMSDEDWNTKLSEGIREIFYLCKKLGGTVSGEHGIGWVQKKYMNIAFDETLIRLQKELKKMFDPNGILNPEKMFE
ncbi:MAG: FAD-binding protein [Bacteroidetes bacterium]|nr:FAD-binding protein [Bacteroidota bacterium]MBV6460817.1 putative FAD-linked oxidoreductase [Flavobacteriales bacterium]MCL4816638.1 FAD-binding protein [Flavobacteriales bacterium]NOG95682.1 FAD-binding protein [Bacteroidota bacterium]CAG0969840.1 glycolate oxidase [Flavobacteriales bacterium]